MNFFILPAAFAVYLYFLRPTIFSTTVDDNVNLLLPGFQGHALQAGLIEENNGSKTYLVTCPPSVDQASCGILGNGLTAISAISSAQLANIDSHERTASVSCNIEGSTYAFCHAKYATIDVQGTLGPKDLNWMQVPITGLYMSDGYATAITKPTTVPVPTARQTSACFSAHAASKCDPTMGSSEANNLAGQLPSLRVFFFMLAVQFLLL